MTVMLSDPDLLKWLRDLDHENASAAADYIEHLKRCDSFRFDQAMSNGGAALGYKNALLEIIDLPCERVDEGHGLAQRAVDTVGDYSGLANKLALVERKFQSANDIEVDRITIKRSEWYT